MKKPKNTSGKTLKTTDKKFIKNFQNIKTDRLIIRRLRLTDAEDIYEFTSKKATSEFLTWYPHKSIERTKNFIKSIVDKYNKNEVTQWAIELIENQKIIGVAGFIAYYPEHLKGEIAFVLSSDYWDKGYMTEALKKIIEYGYNEMGLKRIEAKCEIDNFASERVMQKIGMRLEGCFYKYLMRKGKFRDYKFYAITK